MSDPIEPQASAAAAPTNLQGLRELVVRISRGEAGLTLGTKALSVIGRLVERPEETAIRSITELSATLGVNASTLSRLVRSLGYASFSAFQDVFRDSVTNAHQHFYSGQGHRLIDGQGEDDYVGTVRQLCTDSVRNIDNMLAQLESRDLHAAAERLARAKRVRIYGVRQIHAVATVLCYGLGLVRPDVSLLDSPGLGIAESLAHLGADDALVVISVSPYSRRVVEVSRVAAQAGIAVIAITDSRASPLSANARQAFFIPHDSSFISNSLGAYIVFSEGMVNLVAKELDGSALSALERQEQFIESLNIEMR